MAHRDAFQVFSTCPQSSRHGAETYLDRVVEVARWSESYGCTGMLLYYDHSLVDPWMLVPEVLRVTDHLCPLVAVQPATMHPHTVAKMIASMAFLHGRQIYLNMIAGGFTRDLKAIGDHTPHDRRYDRLREFADIVMALCGGATVTRSGEWYEAEALTLAPAVPSELRPGLLMSGSSPASLATAAALGATAIQYPLPAGEEPASSPAIDKGIRIGIIARPVSTEAWRVAHERFPPSRRGQLVHEMAMAQSDSQWHRSLSDLAAASAAEDNPYWLQPFENYDTFCPYLVGSYDEVAELVASYWEADYRTVILDIPAVEEDLAHTSEVFDLAEALVASRGDRRGDMT